MYIIKLIDTERIKAKFSVSLGPTVPIPAMIQFMCDGITLSGIDMSLECSGYKLSLRKDKCISGKYICVCIMLYIGV